GEQISATATDSAGNTSEFSAVVSANSPGGSGGSGDGGGAPFFLPPPPAGPPLVPAAQLFPEPGPGSGSLAAPDAVFQQATTPAAERASAVALLVQPTGFARSQRPQPDSPARWEAAVLDVPAENLLMES